MSRVVVVLGAPVDSEGRPSAWLLGRLEHALTVIAQSPPPLAVCCTGGPCKSYGGSGKYVEAEVMVAFLRKKLKKSQRKGAAKKKAESSGAFAVDPPFLVDALAAQTFDNAFNVLQLLLENGVWDSIPADEPIIVDLVTSDWHMNRSLLCFSTMFGVLPRPGKVHIRPRSAITSQEEQLRERPREDNLCQGWFPQVLPRYTARLHELLRNPVADKERAGDASPSGDAAAVGNGPTADGELRNQPLVVVLLGGRFEWLCGDGTEWDGRTCGGRVAEALRQVAHGLQRYSRVYLLNKVRAVFRR
jgi:DUF218 domain